MEPLDRWEQRQRTRRQPSTRSRRWAARPRSARPNTSGVSPRARELAAKNAARMAAANTGQVNADHRLRQIIAAILVAPLASRMSVCIIGAALEPDEPRAEARNRTGQLVSVSRSECLSFARQWQRETTQIKRMEHAAHYNLRCGCPETYGTMARLLGIDR